MTKSSITAKALLAALALGAVACSKPAADNGPAASAAASGENAAQTINIRYIDYDSLLSQYTLAQEIAASSQKLMVQYQQQERQKQQEIQTLGAEIERKQQNNIYLSQQSFESDVNNFNKKQNEAARFLSAQQAKINNEISIQQRRLTDSINNFIADYNATRGYDAILFRESGVFFNPALNITEEIVKGLNERYTPAK
ncbi:MAG: OmpH family outer membrane protein [Muribaculaceae bacterium]|nr:OmpH family outer membrane protein [Muribaculaceae bacterium]